MCFLTDRFPTPEWVCRFWVWEIEDSIRNCASHTGKFIFSGNSNYPVPIPLHCFFIHGLYCWYLKQPGTLGLGSGDTAGDGWWCVKETLVYRFISHQVVFNHCYSITLWLAAVSVPSIPWERLVRMHKITEIRISGIHSLANSDSSKWNTQFLKSHEFRLEGPNSNVCAGDS